MRGNWINGVILMEGEIFGNITNCVSWNLCGITNVQRPSSFHIHACAKFIFIRDGYEHATFILLTIAGVVLTQHTFNFYLIIHSKMKWYFYSITLSCIPLRLGVPARHPAPALFTRQMYSLVTFDSIPPIRA